MGYLRLIGGLTILMAGIGAIFEIDIKKIIALSTLSQLGVIIIIICAGNIIHNFKDYQDIRLISSGSNYLPFTISVFIVSNFSLCGLPFMAGFYSKDLILETILIRSLNRLILIILVIGTALTVIYSFRFIVLLCNTGNQ